MLPLLEQLIHRYPLQLRDDLRQTGLELLWRHKDYSGPKPFMEYVGSKLRPTISIEAQRLQSSVSLPNRMGSMPSTVRRAMRELTEQLLREPTTVELAEYLGWSIKRTQSFITTNIQN